MSHPSPWRNGLAKIRSEVMESFIPWISVGVCIHPQETRHCFREVASFCMTKGEKSWEITCREALNSDAVCSWMAEEVDAK